jgi:hypothetical protein
MDRSFSSGWRYTRPLAKSNLRWSRGILLKEAIWSGDAIGFDFIRVTGLAEVGVSP